MIPATNKHISAASFVVIAVLSSLCGAQSTRSTEDSKFLRFVPDDQGGGKLQASVVSYRNASGATVDLIAAVHIADKSFFDGLEQTFSGYDALLYEMVKPRDAVLTSAGPATHPASRAARGSRTLGWVGTMQRFLKDKLELSFQLEEIDYSKPNFVHADLDSETFQQMQADRGESLVKMMIQQMIREMANPSASPSAQLDLTALVQALQSPDRARQLKLVLARQFGAMDEALTALEGPNGSVILTERNRAAMKVLAVRLEAGDRKLGIFYGAGHFKGMEKILTQDMGFKQAGEPVWHTAWDMSSKR